MPKIKIDNLEYPAGYDLFLDSESFLDEVHESEYQKINGGSTPACFAGGVAVGMALVIGAAWVADRVLNKKGSSVCVMQ
jgi:hypothetical protein